MRASSSKSQTTFRQTANAATVPSILHGTISTPADRDSYAIELAAGQRVRAKVECRALGSPAELDVSVTAPDGKTVLRLDTVPDGSADFEVRATLSGRYVLSVQSLTNEGGPEYVYRVTMAMHEPAVSLVSDVSSLAIPRGSYQPLPLSLTRTEFGGPVELELRGAPPGMTLRSKAIRDGESEVVNALAVSDAVPEGLYSVQVIGKISVNGQDRRVSSTTLPLVDRLPTGRGPHGEPFELREDQRRLPPSVIDRIAILVTAPSPYTFELPDRLVTLPRYLETEFRLETTRVAGFREPIAFTARGGSLDPLNLQKPRLKAELAPATPDRPVIKGILKSGVNSELRKQRVTVTAHTTHEGRSIDLTRTFDLVTKVAYEPMPEPRRLEIKGGQTATVSIRANRLPPFHGPIAIQLTGIAGWGLPAELEIPEGVDDAKLKIAVPPGTKPGVYRVGFAGSARVSKFDESVTGQPLEVVVVAAKGGGA